MKFSNPKGKVSCFLAFSPLQTCMLEFNQLPCLHQCMLVCDILWNGDLNSQKPKFCPQKRTVSLAFPIKESKLDENFPSLLLLIKLTMNVTFYPSMVMISEYSPYSDLHFGYSNKMNKHTMLSTHTSVVMRGLISKRFTWWMVCRINSLAWTWRLLWLWGHLKVVPVMFSSCIVCLSLSESKLVTLSGSSPVYFLWHIEVVCSNSDLCSSCSLDEQLYIQNRDMGWKTVMLCLAWVPCYIYVWL